MHFASSVGDRKRLGKISGWSRIVQPAIAFITFPSSEPIIKWPKAYLQLATPLFFPSSYKFLTLEHKEK
jgi:hypothetical protein